MSSKLPWLPRLSTMASSWLEGSLFSPLGVQNSFQKLSKNVLFLQQKSSLYSYPTSPIISPRDLKFKSGQRGFRPDERMRRPDDGLQKFWNLASELLVRTFLVSSSGPWDRLNFALLCRRRPDDGEASSGRKYQISAFFAWNPLDSFPMPLTCMLILSTATLCLQKLVNSLP